MNADLDNATPVEVDLETKQEGIEIITKWSVKNCRFFKMIQDSGLKQFAAFLIKVGATFGPNVNVEKLLPNPTTISRNISAIYETYFEKTKQDIISFKSFGYPVTSDIWTDNYLRSSYISCTIHYIKEGALVGHMLAIESMEGEACTGK